MTYKGDLNDFLEYGADNAEQGTPPEAQQAAVAASLQISARGTPQGHTGIEYWDKKKEITPYDAYLAKKFNDITFTGRLDINANTKTQSVTKLMGDISQDLTSLKNAEDYLGLVENQAGFWSGLNRFANAATLGTIPISAENSRYQNIAQRLFYDIAKSQVGGRPSNEAVRDIKKGFGGDLERAGAKYARTGQGMSTILNGLETKMEQLERQGQPIPPLLIAQWQYYRELSNAAQDSDFNYSKYIKNYQGGQQAQSKTTTPKPYTPTK